MARRSNSAESMRVVILDNEQIGTTLHLLNEEWTRLDQRRSRETPGIQRATISRQEHIEGIMALLRNSPKETYKHGKA